MSKNTTTNVEQASTGTPIESKLVEHRMNTRVVEERTYRDRLAGVLIGILLAPLLVVLVPLRHFTAKREIEEAKGTE